jgi:hypothetical protein
VLERQQVELWIDGYKQLLRPLVMSNIPGYSFRVHVIHLVRDPRGFVYSNEMNKHESEHKSVAIWRRYHRLVRTLYKTGEAVDTERYLCIRYEDLCAEPQKVLNEVFPVLGVASEEVVAAPLVPDKHHLLGNRMLRTFEGDVRLVESWRGHLSAVAQDRILKSSGCFAVEMGYGEKGE